MSARFALPERICSSAIAFAAKPSARTFRSRNLPTSAWASVSTAASLGASGCQSKIKVAKPCILARESRSSATWLATMPVVPRIHNSTGSSRIASAPILFSTSVEGTSPRYRLASKATGNAGSDVLPSTPNWEPDLASRNGTPKSFVNTVARSPSNPSGPELGRSSKASRSAVSSKLVANIGLIRNSGNH
ncbi:hypothetical protein FQZ97_661830 [compost metagenome]